MVKAVAVLAVIAVILVLRALYLSLPAARYPHSYPGSLPAAKRPA